MAKRKWKQGHNPKIKGRPFTPEHRKRISEANKLRFAGERHPGWGKPLPESTRRKIAEANRGKIMSAATRLKISETKRMKYGLSATPSAIHGWLNRWYPRTGVCEACGKRGKTDYASLTAHTYTRNRDDYAELCQSCHLTLDYAEGRRLKALSKPRGPRRPTP